MLRFALLGCGRIGSVHAKNIITNLQAELLGVYDINSVLAESLAKELSVKKLSDIDEIFRSDQIDAIIVASSTSTHADYIERAIANGKPVFCEKPIDLNLDRVNRVYRSIKNSGVLIQLGFNRRFDPGHLAAKRVFQEGRIGDLHQVIITSRDPEMPSPSYYQTAGGLFRDMTIHDFDLARFMLDEEPEEVCALAGGLINPQLMSELGDHDSAMIILKTESGKQCFINNSRTAVYGYDQRVELLGSRGMVQSNNKTPNSMQMFNKDGSQISEPFQYFFIERYSESFVAELNAFVESVETGKPTKVGFEDGRQALILAEAAYLSLKEKRFVKVNEISEMI